MSRPTKLTEDVQEHIQQLVMRGNFLKDAALFCHVEYRTVRRWIDRGEKEEARLANAENPDEEPLESERIYLEFCHAIEHARAYANVHDQNKILMGAEKDPKWALERLKLRNPQWFKQESSLEIKGQLETTKHLELDVVYDEEMLALSDAISDRMNQKAIEGPDAE